MRITLEDPELKPVTKRKPRRVKRYAVTKIYLKDKNQDFHMKIFLDDNDPKV